MIDRPTRLDAANSRRSLELNTSKALARARVLIPLLFGLYSVWLGADSNWDLGNYHLYNPFAWLHGRLLTDLAPAGMQSYFNPLGDVPFYWMTLHLPSRLAGFLMGALHGTAFILLLAIAQRALPDLSEENRYRVPLLLALAGCLSPSFLSGLGNSMGDDTTALLSLAGLLVLLDSWRSLKHNDLKAALTTIASGMLVGLGVGLKLTTACYAVAMCVALLSYPDNVIVRVRLGFLFGVGVLLGWAVTGGYWMLHMWQTFGNPLYPQFAKYFPNPLTLPLGSGDTRWLPHGFIENVLWPFIMAANPKRVGEVPVREIVWPLVYVLLAVSAAVAFARQLRHRGHPGLSARSRFVILYVVAGYLVWMRMFSIYRYIVPIEMLAPVVVFALARMIWGHQKGQRAARWLIGGATIIAIAGGVKTWGHEGWTDPLYRVDVPPIAAPRQTTAIIYSGSTGWGWVVPFFPHDVAFAGFQSSFPATPEYNRRLRAVIASRGGAAFALIDGYYNSRFATMARVNKIAGRFGLTDSNRGCAALRWAVTRLRLHAAVQPVADGAKTCELTVRADDIGGTPAAHSRRIIDAATPAFASIGLTLEPDSCRSYEANIGTGRMMYQWCRLTPSSR